MTKYFAMGLSAVSVLLLGWVVWALVQLGGQKTLGPRPEPLELKPLSVTGKADQVQLAAGIEAMGRIREVGLQVASIPSPLLALPAPGTEVAGSVQMPRRSLSLFMESLSDEPSTVVLDEHLVKAGASLSDGARLKKIQPFKAVVAEKQGRQTLEMPVEQLTVGTLRWADGSPASVSTQVYRSGPPKPKAEAAQ
jgi:hypothetical protein